MYFHRFKNIPQNSTAPVILAFYVQYQLPTYRLNPKSLTVLKKPLVTQMREAETASRKPFLEPRLKVPRTYYLPNLNSYNFSIAYRSGEPLILANHARPRNPKEIPAIFCR